MKKTFAFLLMFTLLATTFPAGSTHAESAFVTSAPMQRYMPAGQPFHAVLGLSDMDEIGSAAMVKQDGQCADIGQEDLRSWLTVYWNFSPFDRVIVPYDETVSYEYYIKLWTKDKTKSYVVYPNGGVIVGAYGEPSFSHGETKKNYIWYLPYIGNGRNALYTADTKLATKYLFENSDTFAGTLRESTPDDAASLPGQNLLMTADASPWAKAEIQKAAACNLLPYELTDGYRNSITRQEFGSLMYRLIATEFSPDSDSRMGEVATIERVTAERQLADKMQAVSFSDCEDYKIQFLAAAGIILGMGDGTFAPDASITREQAATLLYRTAVFLQNKTIPGAGSASLYDDENAISDWARSAVRTMKSMDIMRGTSETRFEPKGIYTVEQAIATALRLYECY